MSKFTKSDEFRIEHIEALSIRALHGVALTGISCFDQAAVICGDAETALRCARRLHGDHMELDGAQDVVVLGPHVFRKLVRLAEFAVANGESAS